MSEHAPQQLRFPPISGFSVRGDFQGGPLSSDFGPMLLRGVDQQIGLIERLGGAIDEQRHPLYGASISGSAGIDTIGNVCFEF
jgi:hypothetical protein